MEPKPTVVNKESDRRPSRLKKLARPPIHTAKSKPVTIDFSWAKEQVAKLAYGYSVLDISRKEDPNILRLFILPTGKKKLSIVQGLGDRIRSVLGPSVLSARPYQRASNEHGGLLVEIAKRTSIAAFVIKDGCMGGYAIKRLYAGLVTKVIEDSIHSDNLEAGILTSLKESSADETLLSAALSHVYEGRLSSSKDLAKELADWKDAKVLHFSHAARPIKIKLKTGAVVSVIKGDPFGYSIDSKKQLLLLTFPAHGMSTPVALQIAPEYIAWLKESDKKSASIVDKLVGI